MLKKRIRTATTPSGRLKSSSLIHPTSSPKMSLNDAAGAKAPKQALHDEAARMKTTRLLLLKAGPPMTRSDLILCCKRSNFTTIV